MKKIKLFSLALLLLITFSACVDQSGKGQIRQAQAGDKIENPRIIASSISTAEILDKLNIDLVGVPNSDVSELPERYRDLPSIGMAMTPDIEIIKTLNPDYVFGPVSLIPDLLPKHEAAKINYGFLNLNNIPGMYKSIGDLGALLGKEKEAKALIDDYEAYIQDYRKSIEGKEKKRVLILMGLPGSYVVATEHSYAGSLVALAGAENVYAGTKEQFLTINTEDMLSKNPDLILRTAHAMPDEVKDMFKKEFETDDIWKHFDCVKKGEVYDLDHAKFGMSANFRYKEALEDLKDILYSN